MCSPKCVPNAPLGIAGTLASSMQNCQCSVDCPDPGCNGCLHVTHCLGAVFVQSVLQITPKVKRNGGGGCKSGQILEVGMAA